MFKISRRLSVILSIVFTVAIFAALCTALIVMISNSSGAYAEFSFEAFPAVPVFIYIAIALGFAADVVLLRLLLLILSGDIFTDKSVACIRLLSWFCMAAGLLFAAIFINIVLWRVNIANIRGTIRMFTVGVLGGTLAASFAAVFMGVILRVVKNVIEEAVAIKSENDLTV